MKILALFLMSLFALPSFALTRAEVGELLKIKNISLEKLEKNGAKVLLGEVTGHLNALPFLRVEVFLTKGEAVLKQEIDSVDFKGSQRLGNIVALRFQGQYVLKQDVKGIIISGQ